MWSTSQIGKIFLLKIASYLKQEFKFLDIHLQDTQISTNLQTTFACNKFLAVQHNQMKNEENEWKR